MNVQEFLLRHTKVSELCVLRDSGYVVATAWIDCEDLFEIPHNIALKEVKGDEWGTLPIITEHGDKIQMPCHYIDFES